MAEAAGGTAWESRNQAHSVQTSVARLLLQQGGPPRLQPQPVQERNHWRLFPGTVQRPAGRDLPMNILELLSASPHSGYRESDHSSVASPEATPHPKSMGLFLSQQSPGKPPTADNQRKQLQGGKLSWKGLPEFPCGNTALTGVVNSILESTLAAVFYYGSPSRPNSSRWNLPRHAGFRGQRAGADHRA